VIPVRGELYTVEPHRMYDGSRTGFQCGRWHCRVLGDVFDSRIADRGWAGRKVVSVQEMKIVGGLWEPDMKTSVEAGKLRPLEVQLDLFGQPASSLAGGAR
jgi:hypothetical protein